MKPSAIGGLRRCSGFGRLRDVVDRLQNHLRIGAGLIPRIKPTPADTRACGCACMLVYVGLPARQVGRFVGTFLARHVASRESTQTPTAPNECSPYRPPEGEP